jgi:lauroyl-KDO2-lipid IV(A) myristoyltransferase
MARRLSKGARRGYMPRVVSHEEPPPFQRAWLAPRHWGLWLGLGVYWCVSKLPWRVRRLLGRGIGALAQRHGERRRRIIDLNLSWCFPELSTEQRREMARAFFRVFGCIAVDYGVLWWGSERRVERMIRVHGIDNIERLRHEGRNVILITGHTVALDFGAAAFVLRYPMTGPMNEARNPVVNWLIARGRVRFMRRHGGHLFSRAANVRAWIATVRGGELMYYLPDEDLGGTEKVVFAPFFGVPMATLTALGRMAKLARASVVPVMTFYNEDDGGYDVHVGAPLDDYPSDSEQRDAEQQNQALEQLIHIHPEQYMWSLRMFQTRPEGEANPYKALKGEG